MSTKVKDIEELKQKELQRSDRKKAKLLQAFENNVKISNMNLPNKYNSFESWEYTRSNRLLYEISLPPDKKYMRYPRGTIIKVDFGVNVGSEFSEQHFAITLSKRDSIYNNCVIVVPLTSKRHKNCINLDGLISKSYLETLQKKVDELQNRIQEIDIENCEFNPNYEKEIKKIKKVLSYYKTIKENLSYACIDQIRTISKLNILPPMNEYDMVGSYKCAEEIMNKIDKQIVRQYTAIDFREFEKFFDNLKDENNK